MNHKPGLDSIDHPVQLIIKNLTYLAYCSDPIPEQPIRASNVTTLALNEPGQEVTYTCDSGFEFVGDPVSVTLTTPLTTTSTTTTSTSTTTTTTTVAMDWKDFRGAKYAKGDNCDCTWAEARVKCQEAGADLVTIHTWEVEKFLNDEFNDFDAWIGLNDQEQEGDYKWASGVPFEYSYWYRTSCATPQNDNSKNCVIWESYTNGRWGLKDCGEKQDYYICQKGSSQSLFWNRIEGAEYAHLERKYCYNTDWDDSKAVCEGLGAELAMVISKEARDAIISTFDFGITDQFWIGMKQDPGGYNGGPYKWEKSGNDALWTDWDRDNPSGTYKECVRYNMEGGIWFWDNEACSHGYTEGALCMKGKPNNPTGYVYTQEYSRDSNERYNDNSMWIESPSPSSATECCQKCYEANRNVKKIAWHGTKCRCFTETTPATCTSTSGNCNADAYVAGACTFISGKKKREVNTSDAMVFSSKQSSKYDDEHSDPVSSTTSTQNIRERRSVDNTLVREISCQGIWSDTAGTWSYQYEVPKYCFSNIPYFISSSIVNLQE